jgi:hypothetical protein
MEIAAMSTVNNICMRGDSPVDNWILDTKNVFTISVENELARLSAATTPFYRRKHG